MDAHPWFAVTQGHALRFFFEQLRDVIDHDRAPEPELLYNASVLAHYAQVSTHAATDLAAPANLSVIFDHFVADSTLVDDGLTPRGLPKAFDFEGVPKQRVTIVDKGVAKDVVWDRRTAKRHDRLAKCRGGKLERRNQ